LAFLRNWSKLINDTTLAGSMTVISFSLKSLLRDFRK
jgi:hypothetical protein